MSLCKSMSATKSMPLSIYVYNTEKHGVKDSVGQSLNLS